MITDSILAESLAGGVSGSGGGSPSAQSVQRFELAYQRASSTSDTNITAVLNPLLGLNADSTRLAQQADRAASLQELKPSDLMMLSMRSHEFLFHCELVSNVANRSSDGVQQLFRQQS